MLYIGEKMVSSDLALIKNMILVQIDTVLTT